MKMRKIIPRKRKSMMMKKIKMRNSLLLQISLKLKLLLRNLLRFSNSRDLLLLSSL